MELLFPMSIKARINLTGQPEDKKNERETGAHETDNIHE